MDFALGQFDVMMKIGEEVREIQETAKWRARHAAVVSSIKVLEEQRADYYENEMMTDPDEEEEGWIIKWINEDFISFLKERLAEYPEGGVGEIFIHRNVEPHTFEYDTFEDQVEVGVWKHIDA
jgi:hypothetical protein